MEKDGGPAADEDGHPFLPLFGDLEGRLTYRHAGGRLLLIMRMRLRKCIHLQLSSRRDGLFSAGVKQRLRRVEPKNDAEEQEEQELIQGFLDEIAHGLHDVSFASMTGYCSSNMAKKNVKEIMVSAETSMQVNNNLCALPAL